MRIVLLAVGSPKDRDLAASIRDYEARVARYFKFEMREVRPVRITAAADREALMESESESLRARIPNGLEVVALDERGEAWTSEQLAEYLADRAVHGRPGVAFVIGGPLGLSDSLRQSCDRLLSLSSFTLPHQLARLVLVEQLYRAGTILRGEPYHRGH